jgi:hypothetical protein
LGESIGGILPFALAATLSPAPITAVILILLSDRARAGGLSFAAGRVLGYSLVITVVILASAVIQPPGDRTPTLAESIARIVLGLAAAGLGVWTWLRRRPADPETAAPRWARVVQTRVAKGITPVKSAGAGFALSIGPKNLLLLGSAGLVIVSAPTGVVGEGVTAAVLLIVASASVITPVALYYALGERAPVLLGSVQGWLFAHAAAIGAGLLTVIGIYLAADGIRDLSG